jgi:apolipoprotein N-acyltransferase
MWPENAFPDFIVDPGLSFRLSGKLRKYLLDRQLNLLTGAYGITPAMKLANSLFALSKAGHWAGPPYEKTILLPFGEYIPGAEKFPILKKWLPDVRDYNRGAGPVLLELNGIRLGPQICYEGLFDFLARDLANRGAQLLVNATNDSWYGDSQEPWQHLYITAAKAVETRRPLLRSTNTGISAAALATGELKDLSPLGQEWFHLYEVPYFSTPPSTVFMRWGYWLDGLAIGLGLLWLAFRNALRS